MAELSSQERMQPVLLDRLTDREPEKKLESRDQRILSLRQVRESVMRDLAWLLNTGSLSQVMDLEEYPEVEKSVLNYGLRDLAGTTISSADVPRIERDLREAILVFEPRILRNTLKVKVVTTSEKMNRNAMVFHIQGDLWAQPLPVNLFLKTELDLETGGVNVTEQTGPGTR
jgi:type VI secretion system protein ImpF